MNLQKQETKDREYGKQKNEEKKGSKGNYSVVKDRGVLRTLSNI